MFEDFVYYDYMYDNKEINRLIDLSTSSKYGPDITENRHREYFSLMEDKHPNPELLFKTYKEFLGFYAEGLRFDENYFSFGSNSKIARYFVGDKFDWHTDNTATTKLIHGQRQITSITYLNDDYVGGETEFYKGPLIKPEKGKTLIFPANICFRHRGKEIIEGCKYICVQHLWG
jgi:hypothetical protein